MILDSWPGSIYEPFLGSGTTLVAAERRKRQCYGMEISPQYVDIALRRWQQTSARQARHEDGMSFAEVADARTTKAKSKP